MKKTITITFLILVAALIAPQARATVLLAEGGGAGFGDTPGGSFFSPTEDLTNETFDQLNPLVLESDKAQKLDTPGEIVSVFLGSYAFPIAGLILFIMLVWGGFEMLTGAVSKKNVDAGKQRITSALIGFLLLFTAYWFAQILEVIFNITIVSGQ